MKKYIIFLLLIVYLFGDGVGRLKSNLTTNYFLLNNRWLKSGNYSKKSINIENKSFVLKHYIKNSSKIEPIIIGGFGFSSLNKGNIDTKFLKIGTGLKYNFSKSSSFDFGITNMWLTSSVKNYNNSINSNIKELFFLTKYKKDYNSTTLSNSFSLHYQNIGYGKSFNKVKGFSGDVELSLLKHNIGYFYDMPLSLKGYVVTSLVDDKLSKEIGFNYATSVGANLFVKIGNYVPIYKEKLKNLNLNLSAQVTKGNNDFKGYKLGVALKLLKF